jgi:O-methyltransferase
MIRHAKVGRGDPKRAAPSCDDAPMKLPKLPKIDPDRAVSFADNMNWGITDPTRFYRGLGEAMQSVAPAYFLGDNLFTWSRNNSMFDDPAFREAWEANAMNDADRAIVWRRYILACAGYHCAQLEGDFVECGVYWGTGIKTVVDYLGGQDFDKTFWGFDTFDTNPVAGHAFEQQKAGFHELVAARFAGYPRVRLVKGLIPASFAVACPERIAYLHIDLNDAHGEIAALEYLFDRVVAGGVIILDDYEWAGPYRAQKVAEDAWLDARSYRVFPLPTGQGLVLKR